MQDRAQAHRLARLVLRGLLLTAAAFVVVLIGSTAAQADDSAPAPRGPLGHRSSAVIDETAPATDTVHRSAQRVTGNATDIVRDVGEQAPPARPVTEAVATVVDRTVHDVTGQVSHVTRTAERLVDGPLVDVIDDVITPVVPPTGGAPEAEADSATSAQQETGLAAASDRQDRRADRASQAPTSAVASETLPTVSAPAPHDAGAEPTHDFPPLNEVLGLGAFSGALSAGSGATGGPTAASTLPAAFVAPADVSLGVVTTADDERLYALPLTPGWSPD